MASTFIEALQPYPREFSIAIVGTPGCGKSTFIAEDARAQGVSDVPPPPFRCKLNANIVQHSMIPVFLDTRNVDSSLRDSHSVTIHELDITRVTTPPLVDGIIVCYDNGDASSFAPIPNFLRTFPSLLRSHPRNLSEIKN